MILEIYINTNIFKEICSFADKRYLLEDAAAKKIKINNKNNSSTTILVRNREACGRDDKIAKHWVSVKLLVNKNEFIPILINELEVKILPSYNTTKINKQYKKIIEKIYDNRLLIIDIWKESNANKAYKMILKLEALMNDKK